MVDSRHGSLQKPARTYSKHGGTSLKRAVNALGSRAIDRRTTLGVFLLEDEVGSSKMWSVRQYSVTVDELLTLVNIALGNADISTCLPGDANHDMQITIDEILTAVNNALNGCPS